MIVCAKRKYRDRDNIYGYTLATMHAINTFVIQDDLFDVYLLDDMQFLLKPILPYYLFNATRDKRVWSDVSCEDICDMYRDGEVIGPPHIIDWFRTKLSYYKDATKQKLIKTIARL